MAQPCALSGASTGDPVHTMHTCRVSALLAVATTRPLSAKTTTVARDIDGSNPARSANEP